MNQLFMYYQLKSLLYSDFLTFFFLTYFFLPMSFSLLGSYPGYSIVSCYYVSLAPLSHL